MSTIKDGGPAFPSGISYRTDCGLREFNGGMTLRDYFAAAALQGVLSEPYRPGQEGAWSAISRQRRGEREHSTTDESLAFVSYCIADAMLAERERGNG
jgi:hypothetical protein